MYRITETLDGKFDCFYRIQDGTEYFTSETMDDAIASMIRAAKFMNCMTITRDDIEFRRELWVAVPATTQVILESFTPAIPPADDIGDQKYPPGLKGLLMKLADQL